jgi:hypothetical protein
MHHILPVKLSVGAQYSPQAGLPQRHRAKETRTIPMHASLGRMSLGIVQSFLCLKGKVENQEYAKKVQNPPKGFKNFRVTAAIIAQKKLLHMTFGGK